MNDFEKIVKISGDEKVELAQGFKDLLNTELMLGQSRYVCRYGTLSDGHERITDAQRYYAAIKEMYVRSESIEDSGADAMLAQADLLDAQEALEAAKKPSDRLRAEANVARAKNRLKRALVNIEDTMRQLDEFNRVRLELQEGVRTRYPGGIEQAERDNWTAVAMHRATIENATHSPQALRHIPLDPITKAKLGLHFNKPELAAWLMTDKGAEIEDKFGGDVAKYIDSKSGARSIEAPGQDCVNV